MRNSVVKVIVGMSGGVDSSVSALLLQQQGYQVEGLFMKNWEEDDTDEYCSAARDLADAQAVCDQLGIPLHRVNFAAEYWDHVFEHFLAEYRAGRTPNPDILCNKEIKFKAFLEYARHLGADKIATGHYARVEKTDTEYRLLKGRDTNKDQSYFLYTLGQRQLENSLFPIGELEKDRVRQLAAAANFINHNKKDSTGICFIGERRFKEFLHRYLPAQPGRIETADGEKLGMHDGLMYYTIGQRQGLGIGGHKKFVEGAWYVADKDLKNNVLIVVQGKDHPLLYKNQFIASQLHWVSDHPPADRFSCMAKIRYRQQAQACTVQKQDQNKWLVTFTEPQWAVTPGQAAVFYHEDVCLGGATIEQM